MPAAMQIFTLDTEFYGMRGIDNLFLSMLRATWPGTGHRQGRALVLQIPLQPCTQLDMSAKRENQRAEKDSGNGPSVAAARRRGQDPWDFSPPVI